MDDRTPEERALYERMMKMSKDLLALIVLGLFRRNETPLSAFDEAREDAYILHMRIEIEDLRAQSAHVKGFMQSVLESGRLWEWREMSQLLEDLDRREQARLDRIENMMADRRERGRRA